MRDGTDIQRCGACLGFAKDFGILPACLTGERCPLGLVSLAKVTDDTIDEMIERLEQLKVRHASS